MWRLDERAVASVVHRLREALDEDVRRALAASEPSPLADDGAETPPDGVQWDWVDSNGQALQVGESDYCETLGSVGEECNLRSLHAQPVHPDMVGGESGRMGLRLYATAIVDLDGGAAAHIMRQSPAATIAVANAVRQVLAMYESAVRERRLEAPFLAQVVVTLARGWGVETK